MAVGTCWCLLAPPREVLQGTCSGDGERRCLQEKLSGVNEKANCPLAQKLVEETVQTCWRFSVYNFSISDKCVCLTDVQKRQEIPALKLDPRWSKMVKWCQIDVKLTQIVRIRFAMFLGTVGRRASSQMKFAILSLGAGRDEQNFQQILVTRSDFRQT